MGKILEIKSGIATKEFTLSYDETKDKYYLDFVSYGAWETRTFYGDYALKEYLREAWSFTESQIDELINSAF